MRPVRRFDVRLTIPDALSGLPELARNLHWSWDPEAIRLFERLWPGWHAGAAHPVEMLHRTSAERLADLAAHSGIVALEALAGGAPLVVARTGGLAELVDGTGAGLLFEPGNADELAGCIELVLRDEDLAATLRRNAAALLAERYSWTAIATAVAAIYAG